MLGKVFVAIIISTVRILKMASGLDRLAGLGLVGLAGVIFVYYTLWVIILPFVESGQWLHQFFPDRMFAIAIPLAAGVLALLLIGTFVTTLTIQKKLQKKKTS